MCGARMGHLLHEPAIAFEPFLLLHDGDRIDSGHPPTAVQTVPEPLTQKRKGLTRITRKDANGGADEAQGRPLAAMLFPVSVGKHGGRLLVALPLRPCFPTLTGNSMTNAKRWILRGSGIIVAVVASASASFAYSVSVFPFPFQCLNRSYKNTMAWQNLRIETI